MGKDRFEKEIEFERIYREIYKILFECLVEVGKKSN